MENSLNSSSPEPTVRGLKSVFKKRTNFDQAFEVSLDESTAQVPQNKTADFDTTFGANKAVPFKKSRKSIQQRFNVTSDDSLVNSESEQSVTFAKPQPVFAKKNKSLVDFFNVSFNETNVSSQPDALSKSIDESNTVYNKKNPFRKASETQSGILVGNESSLGESIKENTQLNLEESQKPSDRSYDAYEADSTTFVTRQNPFKKSVRQKNDSVTQLNLSVTVNNKSMVCKMTGTQNITNSSGVNDEAESSDVRTKFNPFKQESVTNSDSISVTCQRSTDSSKEEILACSMDTSKNIGLDQNISKVTNNTTYLEQSSINDDNLNNWMSDQSDEEMPPPRIPSLPANLSHTKEKPVSTPLGNSSTVSEEKFNEIVSRTEKDTPQKKSNNVGLDQNISKVTNNITHLEQSSVNEDNLDNWMSDQSDEEMPPPRIPSLPANLSHTNEKPVSTSSRNSTTVWQDKFNEIVLNAQRKNKASKVKLSSNTPQKKKPKKSDPNVEKCPENVNRNKPPKLVKPAPFATKKLYEYIIKKLEPKYGIDAVLESENLVLSICDTVKKVTRRKTHQNRLIKQLKKQMAEAGLIETTIDFYEFVIKFLPYSFRVKVVPCLQPVTNVVYPPKDVLNPWDKIL